jgi:hypothetical protein
MATSASSSSSAVTAPARRPKSASGRSSGVTMVICRVVDAHGVDVARSEQRELVGGQRPLDRRRHHESHALGPAVFQVSHEPAEEAGRVLGKECASVGERRVAARAEREHERLIVELSAVGQRTRCS